MPGVQEANLNFAAGKLTVIGSISDEELEKEARKVEPVTLHPVGAPVSAVQQPFWQANGKALRVGIAGLLMIAGWILYERNLFPFAQGVLLASVLISGSGVARKGIRSLLRFEFDMNVLMTVAVTGAILIGEWEEATVVAFLFAVSEMLETYSMEKARQSIRSLMETAPKEATVLRNGQELRMPVEELAVGDVLLVRPGEKVPIDGVIVDGASSINEAAITGESMPVEKSAGDAVYGGTLNQQGAIRIRVTKLVADTTIAKIIHLVEEAQNKRAPAQAFVDRFAKVYTPAVMILAVLVALVPPLWLDGAWERWIYEALALLVAACPCALVVSTPVAVVTAIGTAARHGVLIKGGVFLEQAGTLRAVAFDKTGTLTKGEPEVTDVTGISLTDRELLQIAAGLEKLSEHPLARAIVKRAEELGLRAEAAERLTAVAGKGASGTIGGTVYHIGNLRFFEELWADQIRLPQRNTGPDRAMDAGFPEIQREVLRLQAEGKTVMLVGADGKVLGVIAVADRVRDTSRETVRQLKRTGIEKTVMLTGDNNRTAAAIAKCVGIDESFGELLPEEKLDRIEKLRSRYGQVAMVGDGINDAPALAAASLGIAMGGAGTDAALETADIVLMGDDLAKLPYVVRLSRAALRIIKQNIAFSLTVKLAAVLLVVPGWLTLWLAILADMGATIAVTLNGLRLLRKRPDQ